MILDSPAVERLVEGLRLLPGIGKRSAERLALYLLSAPQTDAIQLSDAIREARARVRRCGVCGNLTEADPCEVCSDPQRDAAVICVVEQPSGAMAVERGGGYAGRYHILHGALSPLDGIGPDELNFASLIARVKNGGIHEVIVATNATTEGEATALYLARQLRPYAVTISRIAHGVPMGSGLEFADEVTLSHAIDGRTQL